MKISKLARQTAKQVFVQCLQEGTLNESRVRQSVAILIKQKPRGYFGILTHFQRLVKLEIEKRTARVESAVALTPDLEGSVRNGLKGKYGSGLNISFATNPELLGGLRIQVGSDVYDGSLLARLKRLQESF